MAWKGWTTKGIKAKYKNKPVKLANEQFSSKLEYEFYCHLKSLKKFGVVKFFLTQVPLRLPGGTRYMIDFVVFFDDDTIRFIEIKGMETDSWKIKKREIEAIYPFEIEVIKRGDF